MSIFTVAATVVRVPVEFAFGVAKGAVKVAYGVVAGTSETEPAPEWADRPSAAPARPRRPAPRNGNGRHREEPAVAAPPPPPAPEPTHVSEEPELVAEVAEEGAEDGAGAEVHIDEPWPGYDEMTAADIADRLLAEDAEVAAAVRLYEASKKGRVKVLEATSRSLGA